MSSIEICNNKFVTSKSTSLIFDVSIYWGEVLSNIPICILRRRPHQPHRPNRDGFLVC